MRRIVPALFLILLPTIAMSQEAPKLETTTQKASYIIGQNMGSGLAADSVPIDFEALMQGFKDALAGKPSVLTPEESQATMTAFQAIVQEVQKKKAEEASKKDIAYLAANKKKEGVVTTESGLQYKILKPGTGATPKPEDTVVCHYKGTFLDGKEFDSSYSRNEPASFPVLQVIKGWTEALQLMKVGAKWQLTIPGNLAYGPQGRSGIPPNAVLLFDIELLEIAGAK
ncbi:MAG: hypothetical protein COA78_31500 [Blastopirellula sp.]|nr:MAG: hypothetical protein COA78_31500 [Blastopirellula sp.]